MRRQTDPPGPSSCRPGHQCNILASGGALEQSGWTESCGHLCPGAPWNVQEAGQAKQALGQGQRGQSLEHRQEQGQIYSGQGLWLGYGLGHYCS